MRYPAVQCVSLLRNSSRNSKQPAFAGRLPEKEWAPITEIGENPLSVIAEGPLCFRVRPGYARDKEAQGSQEDQYFFFREMSALCARERGSTPAPITEIGENP
jgi:hypothetical protein